MKRMDINQINFYLQISSLLTAVGPPENRAPRNPLPLLGVVSGLFVCILGRQSGKFNLQQ